MFHFSFTQILYKTGTFKFTVLPSNPVGCRIASPLQLTKVCMFLQLVIFKPEL